MIDGLLMDLDPLDAVRVCEFDDHGGRMDRPKVQSLLIDPVIQVIVLFFVRGTQQIQDL